MPAANRAYPGWLMVLAACRGASMPVFTFSIFPKPSERRLSAIRGDLRTQIGALRDDTHAQIREIREDSREVRSGIKVLTGKVYELTGQK